MKFTTLIVSAFLLFSFAAHAQNTCLPKCSDEAQVCSKQCIDKAGAKGAPACKKACADAKKECESECSKK